MYIPVLAPENVEKTYNEVHGASLRPQKGRSISEVGIHGVITREAWASTTTYIICFIHFYFWRL